jgi:deoxycytidylate deaminase
MHILHTLKHNFLIIGFTGPLRSGCTTAATFFRDSIDKEIEKQLDTYGTIQKNIENHYKKISKLKSTKSENLTEQKNDLKELLRKREVLKVLESYKNNQFIYISMTDMLIKATIERVNIKTKLKYRDNFDSNKLHFLNQFIQKIRSDFEDIRKIKKLNKIIEDRNFSKLKENEFSLYEAYIERVKKVRRDLIQISKEDELNGEILQDLGDNLRRCGDPFDYITPYNASNPNTVFLIAEEANHVIKFFRSRERSAMHNQLRINHFVVEAFRNPYEVEFFRNRYYEFYLFSIFADQTTRQIRSRFSAKRDDRDKGDNLSTHDINKQNVSECVRLADVAVNNEGKKNMLYMKLLSFFALIKQPGCFAPGRKETAMHMAYSMSVRSTCISRQVGAVIEGPKGYIVGAGWNDVGEGQVGCGYRHFQDVKNLSNNDLILHPEDEEGFRRWLLRGTNGTDAFCYKDKYSEYKIRKKLRKFEKEVSSRFGKVSMEEKRLIIENLQKSLNLKMMQYCRALHAEENAILQSAIIGGMGIRGGTIYTTTFPCELCAKKIYQSGILRVVYTEPYPRSISMEVFFHDGLRQIIFDQFEGVKSQSYFRMYKSTIDRKEFQVLQAM